MTYNCIWFGCSVESDKFTQTAWVGKNEMLTLRSVCDVHKYDTIWRENSCFLNVKDIHIMKNKINPV